jgi:hypothetical protein
MHEWQSELMDRKVVGVVFVVGVLFVFLLVSMDALVT